ncbi:MAG: manganese catalase family protein, partial [Eubacteriales bacterium]|nr:manganese catalase family protein [Eubacteriales bacterium]
MKSCLIKPPILFILIYLFPDAFHLKLSYVLLPYGGPDGEISASMRYLSQRFAMPNRMATAVLNDIGTEELAHLEMVSTIVHQLTRNLSMEEIKN